MKSILLILLSIYSLQAEFTKSNNIVTDTKTKLQWQDNITGAPLKWQDSVSYCEALSLDGYNDWRLPNIIELQSIIDRRNANPAISSVFENTKNKFYWSATTRIHGFNTTAYNLGFSEGILNNNFKLLTTNEDQRYIRCVRSEF